ncbi:MAG: DNA cytosine methyltransferase [Clostridia bacterium]|nr:DNA cytosine methyltransferase [Clostridia bacterium]
MTALTLGSLFDGIGVFPLAASRNGITPLWASEIEKAPISITKRHFPDMAHLGDITRLHGGQIPPVNIITFGSPCQNLSQAGRREGLAGEKSGLFYEATRIIQEMRDATGGIFPTIAVWENVMGALSSSDRLDFMAVLRSLADAPVSMPASGRWAGAGMVRGGSVDLCWRLMDAQHWASPRLARRQRVFVVADFRGRRSHEILFKPRPVQPLPAAGTAGGLPAPGADRDPAFETGRRIPIIHPFQCFRMRGAAKNGEQAMFRNSFGLPTDPFPTLLAGAVSPFALYYPDDPESGCVRFPTEEESERLMGLPVGWTAYGADGAAIPANARYKALGNAIALPCADYIMAGVAEALKGGAGHA